MVEALTTRPVRGLTLDGKLSGPEGCGMGVAVWVGVFVGAVVFVGVGVGVSVGGIGVAVLVGMGVLVEFATCVSSGAGSVVLQADRIRTRMIMRVKRFIIARISIVIFKVWKLRELSYRN